MDPGITVIGVHPNHNSVKAVKFPVEERMVNIYAAGNKFYENIEKNLSSRARGEASSALLAQIYRQMDQLVKYAIGETGIIWIRHQDGYVFHSPDSDVMHLSCLVKVASRLIAHALNVSYPLRVAITQDTLNVDQTEKGMSVTGPGWSDSLKLEKALDWMGGVLYLPQYDGTHQKTIEELVCTAFLVEEQNLA